MLIRKKMINNVKAISVIITCLLISCNYNECKVNNNYKLSLEIDDECSFDSRETVGYVVGLEGVIKNRVEDVYTILGKNNKIYYACNLPESMKVNETDVYFCGELKKIEPTEVTVGILLKLTSMYSKDNKGGSVVKKVMN